MMSECETCSICGEIKPVSEFTTSVQKGRTYRRKQCKRCLSIRYKDTYRASAKKRQVTHKNDLKRFAHKQYKRVYQLWEQELKKHMQLACTRCGYDKLFAVLEFHHRDSDQKQHRPSTLLRKCVSDEHVKLVLSELQKCDLLCANCHRELHWEMNNQKILNQSIQT